MKSMLIAGVLTVVLTLPTLAFGAATITKIGKIRYSLAGIHTGDFRFGRGDGGSFDGCTVNPTRMFNFRLDQSRLVQLLLFAKQNNLDVLVEYSVESTGRCSIRAIEVQ